MKTRKKKTTSKKKRNIKNLGINWALAGLIVVTFTFVISIIDSLFFDEGTKVDRPDLSALIIKTKYENKTGHKISVEIQNGCGIPKLANLYTEYLRNEGFDVIDSKNAANFDFLKTQIIQHNGDKARSIELAKIMNINDSLISNFESNYLVHDLTLIIGHDYMELESYQNAVVHEIPF